MAWLTPDAIPSGTVTKELNIPDAEEWKAVVRGAIYELSRPENWEQFGTLTPEQVADRFRQMFEEFLAS